MIDYPEGRLLRTELNHQEKLLSLFIPNAVSGASLKLELRKELNHSGDDHKWSSRVSAHRLCFNGILMDI